MQNVSEHCVPGKLKELEIVDKRYTRISTSDWQEQAQPIFNQLEKVSLKASYVNQMEPIFKFYRQKMPNLKSLTLSKFDFREDWVQSFPVELSNVAELHLLDVKLEENVKPFKLFLSRLTNLQVFVHLRENLNAPHPELVADCLHERFPQLKGFGCNVGQVFGRFLYTMDEQFKFLEKFTNMTDIYVGCHNATAPFDLHRLIQFVPNIRLFSMAAVGKNLYQPPVVIRRITRSIKDVVVRRRNDFPRSDRVKVIVTDWQYRDFMAFKNINNVISLSIEQCCRR